MEEYRPNPNSFGQQAGGDFSQPAIPQEYIEQQEGYEEPTGEEFLGYSEGKPKEGHYQLFNKVLTLPRSIKVGNIDKPELGDLGISIREALRIELIGKTFGHPVFGKFFGDQANILTDSSMSKKGWLAELFVTQRKVTEKGGSFNQAPNPYAQQQQQQPNKWKEMFKK